MNWIEVLNLVVSILAIFVSGISIYLTHQNKEKQQKLEKEMQVNEFKFSRRKVWYEKQNEVLDSILEKLIEISSNFGTLKLLVEKEINDKDNFTSDDRKEVIDILTLLQDNNNYIRAYEHYLPKAFEKNINLIISSTGHLLIKLDATIDEKDRASDEEIYHHMSTISSNIREMTNELRDMFLE